MHVGLLLTALYQRATYLALPSQVVQAHHDMRTKKRIITVAVGCHLSGESTNATTTKATKKKAILFNGNVNSLSVNEERCSYAHRSKDCGRLNNMARVSRPRCGS